MTETRIPPVHPGEVLLEDFLKPLGISQYRFVIVQMEMDTVFK